MNITTSLKRCALTFGFVALLSSSFVARAGSFLMPGAKIYVEAGDGFDTYLTAALQKKHVPVTVVTNPEMADYLLDGVSDHQKAGWAKVAFMGNIHSDDQASIKLVDKRTSEVIFAYAVNKKSTLHGRQTVAEACAKHLRDVLLTSR